MINLAGADSAAACSVTHVQPLETAKIYLVSAFRSGRALRITGVQEPEADFGHYCILSGTLFATGPFIGSLDPVNGPYLALYTTE